MSDARVTLTKIVYRLSRYHSNRGLGVKGGPKRG